MRNSMKGIWLPQEYTLAQDCLKSLINDSYSMLIQPIIGVDINLFCDLLVRYLWDQGYSDSAFYYIWDELESRIPAEIVGQVLGCAPGSKVNSPQDLNNINYVSGNKPIIMIFSRVGPAADRNWSQLIYEWANYLHAFKGLNEQGRGLRCLFCLDVDIAGMGRGAAVPEPFRFYSWPEPDETTVENFVREHLQDYCEPVSSGIKQYAIYRIMDLGGNRKADLIELMRLIGEMDLRVDPRTMDVLDWSVDNVLVKQAITSIQSMVSEELLYVWKRLFRRGGFTSQEDEKSASVRAILDRLWEQALYTPPWADKTFGSLTPRALAAISWLSKNDERFYEVKGSIPLPWGDRAAREIMDRCLQIERMLKRRAVQLISSSPQLHEQLSDKMDSISRTNSQKTNREIILDAVRWQGYDEYADDLTLLEACTLGSFFYLFDSLGLEQHGDRQEHRRFVEIRNTLAHAHRADWDIYKGFLDIEEKLIGEREK